ncbi:hypothetical protein ACLFLN_11580 [Acinetobacter pittii]
MPSEFLPSKLGVYEWRQTFYNKKTGDSFFCSCFKVALAEKRDEILNMHPHLKNALAHNSFQDSICHICTQTNSDLIYYNSMYGSAFKARYGAYIVKQSIQEGLDEREAENQIRDLKGVARIGERWVNETLLFNYISLLFPQHTSTKRSIPNLAK